MICHWWLCTWLSGCSSPADVPVAPATADPPARPVPVSERTTFEERGPAGSLREQMVGHFAAATDAVWYLALDELGSMRAVVASLEHADAGDLPDDLHPLLPTMTDAAGAWARAPDRATAAQRSAELAATCVACHERWARVEPVTAADLRLPELSVAEAHMVAPYLLWLGLVLPSDEVWAMGAARMLAPPERPGTGPLNERYTRLAARAREASGPDRGAVWTELVGSCPTCHVTAGVQLVGAAPRGLFHPE